MSYRNTDTLGYKASGWFGYKTDEAIHKGGAVPRAAAVNGDT